LQHKTLKEFASKVTLGSRRELNNGAGEKFRSPLMTFGLIILLVGFIIAFLAGISMDPYRETQGTLLSALGRIGTGIVFQLLGIGLILIGKK
jgi:hypothetical protein